MAETVSVRAARFNVPVDPAELTWKALRPAPGAPLTLNGEDQWNPSAKERVAWTGESFEITRYDPFSPAAPTGQPVGDSNRGPFYRAASYILLALGTLLVVALAMIWAARKARAVRSSGR
jgi:hypothetical protein